MDTTNDADKHTNGLEDGVKEAPTLAQKPTVREEDARRDSLSSPSFGSSVDGDDCFQLEAGKLGEAPTSLGGDSSHCKESSRVESDKTEVKTEKRSREDSNELPVPTQTDDSPNEKPCISGSIFSDSAVDSNSDDRTSMKSSLELVIDENIDVHPDLTFKANHSALDYSHVSQSEHSSTYMGFAKQSLASYANETPDTYDPNRIPASIFSKPQDHKEWSVASNDSSYNVQEKRVDAQQKPPVILSIPRANSMLRDSDASAPSFAFPILTADGRNASHEVEEVESQVAPPMDQQKPGLFPCTWLLCLFCC